MGENNSKREVYANAITVSNTFFDFTFAFKKENIFEMEDGEQKKEIEDVACIRVSPQMAKALADLLNGNIKKYEENFGSIPSLTANR